MTQLRTTLTTAQQDFLRLIYGDRDGEITYAPPDGDNVKCLLAEFVPATEGETWIDTAIDGQHWSVAAEIIKGSTPFHTPSFVMTNDSTDFDIAVWRLSEPADDRLNHMLRFASGVEDSDIGWGCPLAGVGGWRVECDGEPHVYSLDELRVDRLVVNGKPTDALVIGSLDKAITLQKIEISAVAPQSKMETIKVKEWLRWAPTIEDFVARNATNRECHKKEFAGAFTGGLCIGKVRQRQSIGHMDIMTFDDDSAPDPVTVCRRLREHGLFGIVYPTFSNGKTKTDLPREEVAKWFDKPWADVSLDDLKTYLRSEKGYQEATLATAALVNDKEHTPAGLCFRVSHGKVVKLRIVLFLSQRFVVADEGDTIDEASNKWRGSYFGVAKALRFKVDPKCSHLNALFYIPSHAPDSKVEDQTIYIVGDGELLDLSKFTPATRQEIEDMGKDDFTLMGEELGGGEHRQFETPGIVDWWVANKDKFAAVEFFRSRSHDLWDERGPSSDGKGMHFKCPRDGKHSNHGDPEDKGFVVWGADDSRAGIAIISCEHKHCEFLGPNGQRDSLPLLDAACVQAGITDINELDRFVAQVEEKPDPAPEPDLAPEPEPAPAPDKPTLRPYRNFTDAKRAISTMDPSDPEATGTVAIRIGMTPKLKSTELEHLKKEWCKLTKMGPKAFQDAVKHGKQLAAEAGDDTHLDDDGLAIMRDLNVRYAIVLIENKIRYAKEPDIRGEMPVFMQREDFGALEADNRIKVTDALGNTKVSPAANEWVRWKGRRIYTRVVFKPTGCPPNEYNIWSGLAVDPVPGNWSLLRGHLLDNVCLGDQRHFHFLMMWLAQLLQQPGIKLGSSVVIRGKKGVGKSKVFDWVRKALGSHALKVSDVGAILNDFNKHQQGLILLVAEEAFWAGDTKAGGKLKDLITSDEMLITPKGIDSVRFANMMRLAMISNEGWVVPAGLEDERRFFVLHCGEARRNDTDFFGEIDRQMENGGLAAMVHELLTCQPDLTMFPKGWNELRLPPETPWLAEQGRHSLGSSAAYRFAVALVEMATWDLSGGWTYKAPNSNSNLDPLVFAPAASSDQLTPDLMNHMLEFLDKNRESSGSRRKAEMEFAEALPRVLGASRFHKKHGNGYRFPPFEEMQAAKRRFMKEADPEVEG